MSTIITTTGAPLSGPPEPPIEYGYRDVSTRLPDGTLDCVRIPLTLEDCLHPEMGDVIMESSLHDLIRMYIAGVFHWKTAEDASALVLSDTGVYWDKPYLRHHCPDIAVIFGIRKRRPNYTRFEVAVEKVRPRLLLEIVSPNTRTNDVDTKIVEYHQAEVPIYVIIDKKKEDDQWQLHGYQWTPTRYLEMPKDEHGRLWLEPIGVWLEVDGQKVRCVDGATGEIIGDYAQTRQQLAEQTARTRVEKERAEAETEARLAAEARLKELEAELERMRNPSKS
jgi:Uma2 family endonuclease